MRFCYQQFCNNPDITDGLRYQLATGNWGQDKQGKPVRQGVAQVLNRLTFMVVRDKGQQNYTILCCVRAIARA